MTVEELKDNSLYQLECLKLPDEVKKAIQKDAEGYGIRYVGYLMAAGTSDDVILRVWAHKKTVRKGLQIREVIRTVLGADTVAYRDMYFTVYGGWRVVFEKSHGSSSNWYGYTYYSYDESDYGRWYEEKKIGVYIDIINLDMLENTKFKYSGFNGKTDLISWMRVYVKYPQVELLGKMGYEPSVKLLKKCGKDKGFAKWLMKNTHKDQNINALVYAYDHNMDVIEAGKLLTAKSEATRYFRGCEAVKNLGIDLRKIKDYCIKQNCRPRSYSDYIEACVALDFDMKDTKNVFPKEFKRMHDLRIDQYQAKKNKITSKKFKEAAEQYVKFETEDKIYTILIPRSKKDLIHEGSVLHHCVGRMGYDNKMIKGQSFIAFVRKSDDKKTPFVTVEFGLKEKAVLQCYGDNDSKPEKAVLKFVDKWSKGVKKAL